MNAIIDNSILIQIDELQMRYIHALDNKNFQEWLETFSTDESTSYICTSAENEENNFPIALMYDDCRGRIEDRVTFIQKIWAGTFEDYRSRHFINRTRTESLGGDVYTVETNFSILYTPESGRTEVQVSGVYKDKIKITGASENNLFLSKKAIYDTTVVPRYIVYPF